MRVIRAPSSGGRIVMSRSQAASFRYRVAIDGAKSSIQDVACMRGHEHEFARMSARPARSHRKVCATRFAQNEKHAPTIAPIRTLASRCEWAAILFLFVSCQQRVRERRALV